MENVERRDKLLLLLVYYASILKHAVYLINNNHNAYRIQTAHCAGNIFHEFVGLMPCQVIIWPSRP